MKHAHQTNQQSSKPLETRHVFLDTQVYRSLQHNPENPALKALLNHIKEHRIVLHIVDIVFLEIKRQIYEEAQKRARELGAIEKDLRRWRKQAPSVTPKMPFHLDAQNIGEQLFKAFQSFIISNCSATLHRALSEVSAENVFEKYFARRPPFDREDSKEFPDAFIVLALSGWAEKADQRIYVVTADKAVGRAVQTDSRLLLVNTIQEVLARAAANIDPKFGELADDLLNSPVFDASFERLLKERITDVEFVYRGELVDGEAYQGELVQIESVDNWTVVGVSETRLSLILSTSIRVSVEVQYEDMTLAMYDQEDGVWIGGESASLQLEEEIVADVLVELDRKSGEAILCDLLTSEICVAGPYDEY